MNVCLHCGAIAQMFGTAGSDGVICMREVCHDCQEAACSCGGKLRNPPAEVHQGCRHALRGGDHE